MSSEVKLSIYAVVSLVPAIPRLSISQLTTVPVLRRISRRPTDAGELLRQSSKSILDARRLCVRPQPVCIWRLDDSSSRARALEPDSPGHRSCRFGRAL